jgi:hypothetical protein
MLIVLSTKDIKRGYRNKNTVLVVKELSDYYGELGSYIDNHHKELYGQTEEYLSPV